MHNSNNVKSETNWERVKREAASDTSIPFNAEDEVYDPNNDAASEAFLEHAVIRRGRGPQRKPVKQAISIRLSPEVITYYRSKGKGWQSLMNADLKRGIKRRTANASATTIPPQGERRAEQQ